MKKDTSIKDFLKFFIAAMVSAFVVQLPAYYSGFRLLNAFLGAIILSIAYSVLKLLEKDMGYD